MTTIKNIEELCVWLDGQKFHLARVGSYNLFDPFEVWLPFLKSARKKRTDITRANAQIELIDRITHACSKLATADDKITNMGDLAAWLGDRHISLARTESHMMFSPFGELFPWLKIDRDKRIIVEGTNAQKDLIVEIMHACGWAAINDIPS